MIQDITLTMLAGQPGVIKFTSISGYGDDITLAGAVKIRGESVPFTAMADTLTIPALPPGVWRYAVLINGSTAWRGSLMVEDSPLFEDGGQAVWAGSVAKSDDVVSVSITFGVPGPQGIQGPQGETGPAPAHEWQGTSLRFKNPDNTWGDLVNLQGPQGEAGTGGGGTITIDDTPTQGSDNAVSSGGVYNYLNDGNVAIGNSSGPLPPGRNFSVAVGTAAWADGSSSTAVGHYATAEADSSVALGFAATAKAMNSVALGVVATAEAESSCAVGAGGYIADPGVTVINAGGEITDGKSTQLYLIPAGSDMANLYTGGAAGLGFVVLDHLSGSVVARGTIPLASICTRHTSDFAPTNVTSISGY